jgi:hypothetical protein
MRIPATAAFVLFQFTAGKAPGQVMFKPGPTQAAKRHFAECVKDLECLIIARSVNGQAYFVDAVPAPEVECIRYRGLKKIATWINVSDLTELCRTFGDWMSPGRTEEIKP